MPKSVIKKREKNIKQSLFPIKVRNSEKQRECQAFFGFQCSDIRKETLT